MSEQVTFEAVELHRLDPSPHVNAAVAYVKAAAAFRDLGAGFELREREHLAFAAESTAHAVCQAALRSEFRVLWTEIDERLNAVLRP